MLIIWPPNITLHCHDISMPSKSNGRCLIAHLLFGGQVEPVCISGCTTQLSLPLKADAESMQAAAFSTTRNVINHLRSTRASFSIASGGAILLI